MSKKWELDDMKKIYELYKIMGPQWQQYIPHFPERTIQQIKLKFHNSVRRGKLLDPDLIRNEEDNVLIKFAQFKKNQHGGDRKLCYGQLTNIIYKLEFLPHQYKQEDDQLFDQFIKLLK
ncbi:hypothetical protein SS50377_24409 [Spironucleus salmonicida]|uniref:HTH myb-type domain-containing protein n=1 Tax=Spironucleus salmonicida TaxID=348837 RepID=V6LQR0_9EUKA|nr:hypothetical protein SS50377_24409 [Spironucleus salmonicida]|eukprot:EST46041.1 hypothetical protein SS50377_14029 [Spironucleus salmonicida]